MAWVNTTDPSDSWSDTTDPSVRHTYGAKFGGTRIRFGENVQYGGGWESISKPSNTWTDN